MRRAVFIDRDGVINRAILREGKPYPPASLSELRLLPGVRDACRKLREAGFALILITNQPDIARGAVSAAAVGEIHSRLQRFLQLDDVRVCPHDDADRCDCRKPKPGLLLDAARTWNIDLGKSFMIGDRWRDVEAGHRAGCQTIYVDYGYRERRPDGPFLRVHSLAEAAHWILRTVQGGLLQYV
jgi:D-glycero-D-manno-heptose 1,7-bisphosphate phosphatase